MKPLLFTYLAFAVLSLAETPKTTTARPEHEIYKGEPARVETPQSTIFHEFPIKPPISDANPLDRHPISITVLDKLEITRGGDTLSVVPAAFQKVQLTVGKNMITGIQVEKCSRNGTDVKRHSVIMRGGVELDLADVLPRKHDKPPEKDYLVEYTITIFETDIPEQHLWAPGSGKAYKVLWTRTFKESAK